MSDDLYCPILKSLCIGKKCALAVKLDHYNVSTYSIIWECGLTITGDMKHRRARTIESESKHA